MEKLKTITTGTKIRTVCIDTLTGIMNELYMKSVNSPTHNKWADWGKGIWQLNTALQNRGFNNVLVLGEPGVGKSTGMRTLPHDSNIWYNADNKNPVWKGGKEEYGTKKNPRRPYHVVVKSYDDILKHIDEAIKRKMFAEEKYAILTGHVEEYRHGNDNRYRLKVLGNLSTKMQLEGKFETVLYAKVIKDGTEIKYVLETQNDGFNTVRSPMGLFEHTIPNDYNFVINKLLKY